MSRRSLSAFALLVPTLAAAAVLAAAFAIPGAIAGSSPSEASAQRETVVKVGQSPVPGQRIVGTVGPGFTISVSPRRVQPGTYRFVVRDRSTMHNWHITGPGVNEKTRVSFQGTKRFTLRLSAGRYAIQCDPHPLQMSTRLRVAAGR